MSAVKTVKESGSLYARLRNKGATISSNGTVYIPPGNVAASKKAQSSISSVVKLREKVSSGGAAKDAIKKTR